MTDSTIEQLSVTKGITLEPCNVSEALQSLAVLSALLRRWFFDQRAVCLDVSFVMTNAMVEALQSTEHGFNEPALVLDLSVRFAGDVLIQVWKSLHGFASQSSAWTFATDTMVPLLPWQVAIHTLNAHINHDVPFMVYEASQINPTKVGNLYRDYVQFSKTVIPLIVTGCMDLLAKRYACPLTIGFDQLPNGRELTIGAISAQLVAWREHVWNEVLALWGASTERDRNAVIDRIERRSHAIAESIASIPVTLRTW